METISFMKLQRSKVFLESFRIIKPLYKPLTFSTWGESMVPLEANSSDNTKCSFTLFYPQLMETRVFWPSMGNAYDLQCTLVQLRIISFRKSENRSWNLKKYHMVQHFWCSWASKSEGFYSLVLVKKLTNWLKVEHEWKNCEIWPTLLSKNLGKIDSVHYLRKLAQMK